MNDPMETEEVSIDYSYSPMTVGMSMSNTNFTPYYNYFAPQNYGFFNNNSEFEEEQPRQIQNQLPNYYGNNSPAYSDQPQLASLWYPQQNDMLPQRVGLFEWENLVQSNNTTKISVPFQPYNEQPVRQENNHFNNSFEQPIPNSNTEIPEPALTADNESNWYQDELWEGASHGSFDQTHINANIQSPLSSLAGDEQPSHCDLMVLNEISSIIDPLDKDLNESGSSDLDGEPFEKKRKIEHFVSKERINLPVEIQPQDRWERLPGRVLCAITRGCRYYFTRCSGIKFKSVCQVLDEKAIETQKKFEKFIVKYKRVWKTWEEITNFVYDDGDSEMAWVLMELVSSFLSCKEDVELLLANTKMSEKERNRIRVDKAIMKESCILHFYPISQSWMKSLY